MPKYSVLINRQLSCRLHTEITVEADNEDEAWNKAYEIIDFGDLEVRDCIYDDDSITKIEE